MTHVTGGLLGYLEENDLVIIAMVDKDGSWLKGLGKIVARLWTVDLTPPKFQIAVCRRWEFLSAESDPAKVMKVTQRMVEHFEKAQQLIGV